MAKDLEQLSIANETYDVKDKNAVHKSGDERIEGTKTFASAVPLEVSGGVQSGNNNAVNGNAVYDAIGSAIDANNTGAVLPAINQAITNYDGEAEAKFATKPNYHEERTQELVRDTNSIPAGSTSVVIMAANAYNPGEMIAIHGEMNYNGNDWLEDFPQPMTFQVYGRMLSDTSGTYTKLNEVAVYPIVATRLVGSHPTPLVTTDHIEYKILCYRFFLSIPKNLTNETIILQMRAGNSGIGYDEKAFSLHTLATRFM